MMQDHIFKKMTFQELTIEGFSRAAVQTYWHIPEMKLGFDLGAQPWNFMGTPRWFVSHTHMDHILMLPAYVARRRMMKMEPPIIYMPEEGVDTVKQLLSVFSRLDHGRLPCKIVAIAPGDEIKLSRELVVTVHRTWHTIPSLGYLVWECRKKLKPQYAGLSENQLRDLAITGTALSDEIRRPRVAYFGDSTARGFDENPDFYRADVLIFEMTFVAEAHRMEEIHKFGHCHLDDILERRDNFQNQLLIASHFSTRCHDYQIVNTVKSRVPDMFDGRLTLWL
ncbi:MAG: metal-dependent hydrolase [Planctomycetaceae bacterium]|jgi:ribonuclease Z|nr:metal-dependent hydrolase [Planctomycetaceae bacterium]